jgi:hypothetical protein
MRKFAIVTIVASLIIPAGASAQQQQRPARPTRPAPAAPSVLEQRSSRPPAPESPAVAARQVLGADAVSLRDYCIFKNDLYSPGSKLCAAKNIALTCEWSGDRPGDERAR